MWDKGGLQECSGERFANVCLDNKGNWLVLKGWEAAAQG